MPTAPTALPPTAAPVPPSAPPSDGPITYLWAAEHVLRTQRRPMRVKDIVSIAQEEGLFSSAMYSSTPQKSLQARLSMEIVRNGERSHFMRIAKGLFHLRELHDDYRNPESSLGSLGLTGPPQMRPFVPSTRTPRPPTEYVLAVPATACRNLLDFHGFKANTEHTLQELLESPVKHLPRRFAEETESY